MESTVGSVATKPVSRVSLRRLMGGASLGAVALLMLPSAAHAQNQDRWWDANGPQAGSGGTGDWDASTPIWSDSNSDVLGPYRPWVNDPANPDNAIFGVTAAGTTTTVGTITVTVPITVHNMTFQTVNNWVLNGGTITLAGTNPTITTHNHTTINSIIAGTAGLTKNGAGNLTLNGANTFSGGITINGVTLIAKDDAALGALSNNITTGVGSDVGFHLLNGTTNRTITVNGTRLTVNGAGAGSALITGSGNVNVSVGVTMSNNASNYTGTTQFNACNGVCATYFTSIGNLGEASSLGAPTTVANGTITWQQSSQYGDYLIYLGDGDSSNRNWVVNASSGGVFRNQGTGTLALSGTMAAAGGVQFIADSADFALSGIISGNSTMLLSGSSGHSVTLTGANTYTGLTSIFGLANIPTLSNSGVASPIGTNAAVALANNGILNFTGSGSSSDRTFTSDGATSLTNSGTGALTLSGTLSFVAGGTDTLTLGGSYAGTNTLSGVISGTGNLASTGSSTWLLTGTNTRTGTIAVNGGTLQAGSASALGTVTAVTVNSGTLDLNGNDLTTPTLNGTGGTVALGTANLTIDGTAASAYAGSITGDGTVMGQGGLIKRGTGTLTLSGANSYTGDTTVNGGTLALNFAAASAPASDIVSSDSKLVLSGGVVTATGGNGEANSQTFDGLTVAAGSNRITATAGSGGGSSMTINLGAITPTGGLVDFGVSASGIITTTTNVGSNLGGWATINGSDYAKVDGTGSIVAFTALDYTNEDNAANWNTDGQYISDAGGAANTPFTGTVDNNVQLGGLKYAAAANSIVTIGAGNTLGIDGAILVGSTVGNTSQEISGAGQLTGAVGGGTLGVQNSSGTFVIRSTIVDNGGAIGFAKTGAGTVNLTASNTYTGATTLSGGTLWIGTIADGGVASTLGASSNAASNLVLESGRLYYSGGTATTDRGFTLVNGGASRTIEVVNSGTNLTFTGLVTSPDDAGLVKAGPGTLTLANDTNDYVGVTNVSGGILSVDTLANGGIVSGIGKSSAASSNLVMQTGGTLQYTGGDVVSDRGFTLANGLGGIDVSNGATTLTLGGIAAGGGVLVKSGAGTLVLGGTNTYSGGTTVSAGTLRAASAQAFGSTTASMSVSTGATLDINSVAGIQVAALTGGGNVTLGSATLTVGGVNSGTPGFTGTISGTGGLTKTGGGTQVITGCNNSYTGVTTVNGGGLSTDCILNGGVNSGLGASSSASSNLVIRDSGILSYTAVGVNQTTDRGFTVANSWGYFQVDDAGTRLEFTGAVVGGGHLIKRGAGTLVLTGDNTYTGQTRVEAGRLVAGSSGAFDQATEGLMTSNVADAAFDLNGYNASFLWLAGGGSTGGNIALNGGTLTVTNGSNQTFSGSITGTGNFVKTGGGGQILAGCNSSYTGTTTITAGALQVDCLANGLANSAIGASSNAAGNLIINGGTFRYSGAAGSTDRLFTLGSSATSKIEASGTGAINFTNTGAIAFSSPGTSQTITIGGTSPADNRLGVQITNNGAGTTSLTKADAGTWILANQNSTYTGVTSITGGVLGVDKLANGGVASSIGMSSGAASSLLIGSGGTLRYTGAGDTTDRQFTLGVGTTAIESSGSGAVVFSNTAAVSYSGTGTRVVSLGGTNTGNNVMGATIGNQSGVNISSLAKNGTGTWVLTGTNTYTGNTNVNAGTLIIGNGGTTGSIASTTSIVSAGGVLGFNRSDAVAFAGTITGAGAVQQLGSGTTTLTGTNTYTGGTTISAGTLQLGSGAGGGATGSIVGNVVNNGIFAFNRNNAYTFAGTISGTGAVSQVGSGTTTLSGTNSYQGGTDINAGTLQVSADANLGAAGGALRFNGGTLNTTASFTSARATNLAGAGTFLTDPGTTLTQNGAVSGTGTLTKTGNGTLILAADNSYTGLTTVSAGTLQVGNGGATGTLTSNVVNNGTLTFNRAGTSTYAGAITGTGPVNLLGGGTYDFTGDSNYSGGTTITSSALRLASGGSITTGFTQLSGTGAVLTVDGVGSALTTGLLLFGGAGESGTVNILNGGVATVTTGGNTLIGQSGTNPAVVNIDGAGSLLSLNSTIGIGSNGANTAATVNITNGGRLQSVGTSTLGVAFFVPTAPKAMTVSGAGSSWANNGRLNLNNGSLSILDGGSVTATLGFMALTSGTADLLVSGASSTYSVTGDQSVANSIGTGIVTLADGGRMSVSGALTAANAAGATAIFNIGGAEGQAAAAAGVLDAATLAFGPGTGRLNFNHTDTNYGFATAVSGAGTINQVAGVTRLTGNSSAFTGTTSVSGGTLLVNGTLGDVTSVANVLGGGTLGGTGTIGGNVTVGAGATLAPGSNGVGALAIAGALNLASPNARLAFEFGQANAPGNPLNDVVNVGGNLTLDGAIDVAVSPGGSFDIGLYRIFNYGGALTNNGLDVGTLPAGVDPADVFVQTSIAGQVNLVNANGVTLNFWDGAAGPKFDGVVNGGNGVWQSSAGNDSWTDPSGQVNAPFSDNAVAIFSAASGTVTVDDSLGAVAAGGMQFASDGYVITGDAVTLANPQSVIRVGDGTGAGAGYTATINSVLGGAGVQLVKTDLGTLVLTGANTYTGGTLINAGTLRISSDASLGDAAGALSLDGAALNTTADIASGRDVDLLGAGTFATDAATTLTLNGLVSGAGALTKAGAGSLVLTNANNYAGGTTISAGTLRIGNGGTTGSIVGDVTDNGTLAFDRSDNLVFGGVISGTGSLSQLGSGILTLTGDNAYTGGTTISAGTLQLGNGGATGGIVGDIVNGGALIFNRSNAYSFAGTISGSGDVRQEGTGTTILTADNSYTGSTVISSGTLLINGNQTAAVGTTNVLGGGALGGTGTIGGDVFVGGGATLTPGDATGPGTLTINGNLGFSPNAVLAYEFGQSNVVGGPLNDLTRVGGDLTLDGTIDVTVTPGGSFDVGLYRVISYGGTLTDNGLALGTLPAGSLVAVQTSVAGQVNLINAAGATLNFWDGAAPANKADNAVNGGDGIWQNSSGNNNWTELTGAVNGAYTDGSFAIFAAAPGTVSIDNGLGAVIASGLQFAVDGYTVTGQDLALVGPQSVIRVGDGTVDGLGYVATIASTVTGNTQLVKTDLGTLILSGTNSYTGGTRINVGTLRISSDANLGDAAGGLSFDGGTLNTTANITSSRNVSLIGTGTFVTDAGTSLIFTGALSGAGNLIKDGAGILALNDTSNHSGTTTVRAGSLFVNGDLSAATGLTSVASGSTLGGSGIIGGDVVVADGGTLAPGNSPGTLTINGGLALNAGSVLNYEFGQANVVGGPLNDLVNIGGDLTLDGTINVTQSAGGSFGPGIYRVFNYAGALIDNGLTLGTMPGGSAVSVQTAVAGQVNLVNSAGLTLSFWDGAAGPKNDNIVQGGNGVWRVGGGSNNWTDLNGTVNADYAQDSYAIFSAAPGTVTVDNAGGNVLATGMQFASDGYTITGGPLTLTGAQAIVQVGDGTAASAGMTATIGAALTGSAQLVKTDAGTLVLTAASNYTGGTAINGGTIRISQDLGLGDNGGALSFDGGTLNTAADMAMIRNVNLVGIGTIDVDPGVLTVNGVVSGGGGLVKNGAGLMVLAAANSYTGTTTVNAGTLQLGDGGTTGSIAGNVVNGGTLVFNRSNQYSFGGTISGAGVVRQVGSGTTVLTAANSYTGGTTITNGVLALGDGGTTGSITGDVANNGRFAVNRSNMYTLTGTISGSGELFQMGTGTTILTAANSYTGATRVSAGTLLINGDQSAATGLTSLAADATLGGTGTIGGDVRVGAGTLAPGAGGAGTLTINGDLSMVAGSRLAVDFGAANAVGSPLNDLVNVGGDLVLDGTIDVAITPGGAFDIGLYRIANYAGTLTNNGLAIGTMPAGAELAVQTSILGQVNLVNTGSAVLNFWDGNTGPKFNGAVNGGSGVWWATGTDNWTDMTGAVNAAYDNGAFAVFAGASGLVTIDNGQGAVTASGLQFAASGGYRIQGDALTLTGPQSVIRVGDGTSAGLGYSVIIASEITGNTQLIKTDLGRLELTGANSYTGGTALNGGTVRISSDANLGAASGGLSFNGGTLNTTADLTSARAVDLAGQGVFSTDAGTTLALTGNLTGAGLIGKLGAGTLVLAGTGSQTGGMEVVQGTLLVNGNYAGATGLVTMNQLTTLGGTGTIGGNVNLSGTLAPGANGVGTLTINGDLIISQLATLAYEFGQAGVAGGALNDLVNVGGNLILDGTINVAVPAGGAFDAGIYRVFNYGGTLTDNRLTLGAMPAGSNVSVQTSIAGQVNLVNSAGLSLAFWDGASGPKNNGVINGGTGIWQNGTGNDNWADASGAVNAPYSDGAFAVFGGTGGTVTVDNGLGQVAASGMQFAANGYTVTGGGIALAGTSSTIRVGDGSTGGAGYTATINSVLSGNTQLVKTDAGTLVLGGTNSYTGGTAINGGIVQITADANLGAATGGVTLDGGTLATSATMSSARDFALAGAGTISTAGGTTFTLSGTLTGTGAFTKAGAGTLVLTGDSSGYTGSTRIEGTLAVNGSLCGDVNVLAGARLQGTGTICTTHNAGTIAPGNSIGTLTVAGDYTSAGGRLEIEAELGGDASPADRLVVTGSTSGTTEIEVINTGGTGAATVEGIKIVDVGGTSNGVFTLDGDYVFQGDPAIIAGAYGYRLYKGGVSTPADGDWYLRSSLLDAPAPNTPNVPLYQPGVPVYEAYGQTLLALNDIGTLQQRVGNRQWAQTESGAPSGIWGRMQASRSRPNAVASTSLSDVHVESWKLEIGADHVLSERGDGASLVLGVLGGYGEANASIGSIYGNGSIKTKGYSAGATLSWFGPQGFYVDGRAQVTWFDSKLKSSVLGTLAEGNNGTGQAYSVEVGKRSPLSGGLSVTPQIQIVYQTAGFDRFTDPNGAEISSRLGDSLKTRWGIALDRHDARSHLYGVANLSYEWLDGTITHVSGTPIARENHRLWGELGLGGSLLLGDRLTLYTEVSGNTAINDFGKSYSLKGTAGLRLAF